MSLHLSADDRDGYEHTGWIAPVEADAWKQDAPTATTVTSFWCGGCEFQDFWVADIPDDVARQAWLEHPDTTNPQTLLTGYLVVAP